MRNKIYLETTVISYLTSRPSRDLIVAAHQQITRDWWEDLSGEFALFASQAVLREAASGDPQAADRRLAALDALVILDITKNAEALAGKLLNTGLIPQRATEDALHIALATVHGMDYLLIWNCKHIANARIRDELESLVLAEGYRASVICTPEELMGG